MTATMIFPLEGRRVYVAGHTGLAGSAVVRRLASENCEILTVSRKQLDLTRQKDVEDWMAATRPDAIFLIAGRAGGIHANATRPAEFLYDNLTIEANLIHTAWRVGVKKLLFLATSSVYPREAEQPMKEEALLTGPLEPTNEAYAVAKIAGIKLCQAYRQQYGCDYISAISANLFGPGDRHDSLNSHVAAAMIMKIHAAKTAGEDSIVIWGSGTPRRGFLFTEDLADGCVFMMKHYSDYSHLNLGTGVDITIRELAETVAKVAGWSGGFSYDASKPDGMPRKVMDVSRATALGWRASTPFEEGMRRAYDWYVEHVTGAGKT